MNNFEQMSELKTSYVNTDYFSEPFSHRIEVNGKFKTYVINPSRVIELFPGYIEMDVENKKKKKDVTGVLITDYMNKNKVLTYTSKEGTVRVLRSV